MRGKDGGRGARGRKSGCLAICEEEDGEEEEVEEMEEEEEEKNWDAKSFARRSGGRGGMQGDTFRHGHFKLILEQSTRKGEHISLQVSM